MSSHTYLPSPTVACALLATVFAVVPAFAMPQVGGSVTAQAGTCVDTHSVPANTALPSLSLSASATCQGVTATAGASAVGFTGSTGLSSGGPDGGAPNTVASASVSMYDQWRIQAPDGTAPGIVPIWAILNVTVDTTFQGNYLPGGRFLDYTLRVREGAAGSGEGDPGAPWFTFSGIANETGHLGFLNANPINFTFNAAGLALADISMSLLSPGTTAGFSESVASISLILPQGYTASTSSGTQLMFMVPEPETYAMLLAGLGLVGFAARRKHKHANGTGQANPA